MKGVAAGGRVKQREAYLDYFGCYYLLPCYCSATSYPAAAILLLPLLPYCPLVPAAAGRNYSPTVALLPLLPLCLRVRGPKASRSGGDD